MRNKNEFRTIVYLRQELIKETFDCCTTDILRNINDNSCGNEIRKDLFSQYFKNVSIFHAEDVPDLENIDYSKAIFTNKKPNEI